MKNVKQFYVIFIIMLLSSFLITNISFAQTHIPYGSVSGTWTIEGSPYIIDGPIHITADSLLTIEPGVQVLFSGNYMFVIYGRLLAVGTVCDTIVFTALDTTITWKSLRFYQTNTNGQDSSKVIYCKLEYGKSVIHCENSSDILIKNCLITKNYSGFSGGGICLDESSPNLLNVIISKNTAEDYGGGISCTDSSNPSLVNVIIIGNNSGGIWCNDNSNPTLENVTITDNIGGGIVCTNSSSPILNNVTINENEGGGIACSNNSNPTLDNVIISNNSIYGGLFFSYSNPILNDVIIKENTSNEIGGGIYCFGESNLILKDAVIKDNNSLSGGGIYCDFGAEMSLVNVVIAGNTAVYSGGAITCFNQCNMSLTNVTISRDTVSVGAGGVIYCDFESNMNFMNSILWDNTPNYISISCGAVVTFAFSDIQGGWQGEGNIDADPLFADDYFHLSEGSPCIDAGNPDTVYNDHEDPENPGYALYPAMGTIRNDMGAYGGSGYYEPPVAVDEQIITNKSNIQLNNYPNPFHTTTTISFLLHRRDTEYAEIKIYNIKGQLVKQFKRQPPICSGVKGKNIEVVWDGKDDNGHCLVSGIYLVRLKTEKNVNVKKIVKLDL